MSTARLIVMIVLVVTVSSMIMAVTPAAADWDVNGTRLVGTKALLSSALVLTHGELEVVGWGVTFGCAASELGVSGGELVAPDEVRAKGLTFKSCSANGGNCSLPENSILTLALHGLAELEGSSAVLVKMLPLPSRTFAVLTFEGNNCALRGQQPIIGSVDLLAPNGQTASVLQLVNAFSLPHNLKVGSSEGNLLGLQADVRLASGEAWNFL